MEKKTECKVYIIDLECEKCKKGNMVSMHKMKKAIDNKSVMVYHKCSKCGVVIEVKNREYPQMEYEKILIK